MAKTTEAGSKAAASAHSVGKKHKKEKPKKQFSLFVRVAYISFLCFCAITMFQILAQIDSYNKEIRSVEAEIAAYQVQIEAIEQELAEPYDNAFVRKIARRRLSLSLPDDIIIYNDLSE